MRYLILCAPFIPNLTLLVFALLLIPGCGTFDFPGVTTPSQSTATATGTDTSTATSTATSTDTQTAPRNAANTPQVVVNVNTTQTTTQGSSVAQPAPMCVCDPATHYCYSGQAGVVCPQIYTYGNPNE